MWHWQVELAYQACQGDWEMGSECRRTWLHVVPPVLANKRCQRVDILCLQFKTGRPGHRQNWATSRAGSLLG